MKRIVYKKLDGDILEFYDTDVNLDGLNNDLKFVECECNGAETNISEITGTIKDYSNYNDRITISSYEFLKRFTQAERIAIRSSTDVYVMDFVSLTWAAQIVDFSDVDTLAGMAYLVTTGLLTEARKIEILS
ncbi:MAG: hypothetical protein A2017_06610 [Lentisphaerae bacterium GWF2_44_16]|nr:MAG: hypothetical protein A2017_06610 [Lentisphaerae bacterium GWF2_44_16]